MNRNIVCKRALWLGSMILFFLPITACQTVKETPPVALKVASLAPGVTHTFLRESDPPIQIGDNFGNIRDVERFRVANPTTRFSGRTYTWPFTLAVQPSGATVSLKIFSLVLPYGETQYDCPTVLIINGKEVADLRKGAGKKTGKPAKISVEVLATRLKVGKNTLSVEEKICVGTKAQGGTYWNDSVIISASIALR